LEIYCIKTLYSSFSYADSLQPKYWCKYCSTYVRDTKLEKQNHEATGKHQGSLKRFLRDLHRGNEQDEREKQRAKDEVQRLNGVVTGSRTAPTPAVVTERKGAVPRSAPEPRQPTPADRKRQLAQLAEMGIAIPDEFRGEMAMAGDWKVLETVRLQDSKAELGVDATNIGVRKRRLSNPEEQMEGNGQTRRKGWGSTTKSFPIREQEQSLDSLLQGSSILKGSSISQDTKDSDQAQGLSGPTVEKSEDTQTPSNIKREDSDFGLDKVVSPMPGLEQDVDSDVKKDENSEPSAVVFKKRKNKSIRQK
jgi:hypothetical protein